MDPAVMATSRRAFLGGTACVALLAGAPAVALEFSGAQVWSAGHVGLAADMAWWDPRGESERSCFPQLPSGEPLTQEQVDWMI